MYAGVPRIIPGRVGGGVATVVEADATGGTAAVCGAAFASPKSRIFTVRSGRTFTLAGFKSR
jgi:hypothetical protein